jgi:hypothetical protein
VLGSTSESGLHALSIRIIGAQKPDHLLPSLTFRITPHKWLEPQLQIQRDRR